MPSSPMRCHTGSAVALAQEAKAAVTTPFVPVASGVENFKPSSGPAIGTGLPPVMSSRR
jgi:hypothetical protein